MREDPLQRINSALFDLNQALAALGRDDKREVEDRINEAIRKLRHAREALGLS